MTGGQQEDPSGLDEPWVIEALAVGLGKPIYGVNHLAAHVAVDVIEHDIEIRPVRPLPATPILTAVIKNGLSTIR